MNPFLDRVAHHADSWKGHADRPIQGVWRRIVCFPSRSFRVHLARAKEARLSQEAIALADGAWNMPIKRAGSTIHLSNQAVTNWTRSICISLRIDWTAACPNTISLNANDRAALLDFSAPHDSVSAGMLQLVLGLNRGTSYLRSRSEQIVATFSLLGSFLPHLQGENVGGGPHRS